MLGLLLPYITFLVCPWRYDSRGSAHTLKLRFKPSIKWTPPTRKHSGCVPLGGLFEDQSKLTQTMMYQRNR